MIVNTCAVTAEAVRKAKQEIRRLSRENPGAAIIVTGCAAQTEPETFAAMPEVTRVVGNHEKMQAETWTGLAAPDLIGVTERVQVDDIMSVRETAGHLIDGFGRHRAYVQVQNGCDHRCTFCIIPYGRGNSRSVPAGVVVEQINRLVDRGFNEVVLTGVDLTSWGADLPGEPKLGDLVRRILKLTSVPRLRISSIDSIEADPALIEAIATEARLMPHLHLSLQAGDDLILKRMKRRHLRDDAIRFCEEVAGLAARDGLRGRHHRGVSDRDGGDVPAVAGPGPGLRADLPARLPLQPPQGDPGGADAAGSGAGDQGAGGAAAGAGRPGSG